MDKAQEALQLHINGFNCSQSVLAVFAKELGISKKTALRVSTGFGGGMRMGEVCGALTGALMALGLHNGHDVEGDLEEKQRANDMTLAFVGKFKMLNGAVRCVDILEGLNASIPEEKELIEERGLRQIHCTKAIEIAVSLVQEHLE